MSAIAPFIQSRILEVVAQEYGPQAVLAVREVSEQRLGVPFEELDYALLPRLVQALRATDASSGALSDGSPEEGGERSAHAYPWATSFAFAVAALLAAMRPDRTGDVLPPWLAPVPAYSLVGGG